MVVEHDLVPVLAREYDEDREERSAEVIKVVARGIIFPEDHPLLPRAGEVVLGVVVLGVRVHATEELDAEQDEDEHHEQKQQGKVEDLLERLDQCRNDLAQRVNCAHELEEAEDAEGAQHRER